MLKKLINNYAFEKFKHLELSDSILEHSQIFSDSIKILQALQQWTHKEAKKYPKNL